MDTTIKTTSPQKIKSKFTDEFEQYLKKQCMKTTFNGVELETFTWYKKVLGLAQRKVLNQKNKAEVFIISAFIFSQ